jgi:hypothetical protein
MTLFAVGMAVSNRQLSVETYRFAADSVQAAVSRRRRHAEAETES